MSYVDLHVHSNASDGTLSPEQVVRLAHEAGLSAIALTDHDTTAGVAGAAEAGAELGLEVVPGIEVSSSFRDHEIHILGLFVDTDSPSLQAALKEFRHHRDQRNQEMLGRFDAHGIHLTAEDLCAGNPDTVITRAHVARALLAKGRLSGRPGHERPGGISLLPQPPGKRQASGNGGAPPSALHRRFRLPRQQ